MRLRAMGFMILVVLFATAVPAGAQTPGLHYSEDVVFTVLEDSVRVDLTATMTNNTVERRQGDTVFFSFFDTFIFIAPTGVTDLSISSNGSALSSSTERLDDDFDVVSATLPEQLRSGDSRSFNVSYTLPRGEPRSDSAFLSNPAYHGFPLWSFSDPGTGSLTLRVPEDAEVSELGVTLQRRGTEDGFVTWEPLRFDVPEDFFTYVNVIRDDRLVEQRFDVSGQEILLRSWPGDSEWVEFAQTAIEDGVPALEDRIGAPIPDQDTLEVTASVTPFLFGYAGWYDPSNTSIEIGNELDRGVMLHELSHAWFNESLFMDRWMIEGLAEEFSWQIDRQLGEFDNELPTTPRATDAGAAPLNQWSSVLTDLGNEELREREVYSYNASWFVVRELAEIVGTDGLQQMILAADSDAPSYAGANRSLLPNDWRRVLDLASNQTDAAGEAALDELWLSLVVDEREAELVTARREVRDQYLHFRDRPLGWAIPQDIEQAMADWRFDDAEELLREASRVLDLQRRVIYQADLAGLEAAEAGRDAYEQPVPDYALALTVLGEQEEAIESVVSVRDLATRPLTAEEQRGFVDPSLDRYVDEAESAYATNRFADVIDLRDQLATSRRDAASIGSTRLLWSRLGLGAAVVMVLLGIGGLARSRPGQRSKNEAASPTAA